MRKDPRQAWGRQPGHAKHARSARDSSDRLRGSQMVRACSTCRARRAPHRLPASHPHSSICDPQFRGPSHPATNHPWGQRIMEGRRGLAGAGVHRRFTGGLIRCLQGDYRGLLGDRLGSERVTGRHKRSQGIAGGRRGSGGLAGASSVLKSNLGDQPVFVCCFSVSWLFFWWGGDQPVNAWPKGRPRSAARRGSKA